MQKPQRKKGDGCFRTLANGSVEYQVPLEPDIYGQRRRKAFYGKDEAECRRKYKEFLKKGGKQVAPSKASTVSVWADNWLETYKKAVLRTAPMRITVTSSAMSRSTASTS